MYSLYDIYHDLSTYLNFIVDTQPIGENEKKIAPYTKIIWYYMNECVHIIGIL